MKLEYYDESDFEKSVIDFENKQVEIANKISNDFNGITMVASDKCSLLVLFEKDEKKYKINISRIDD